MSVVFMVGYKYSELWLQLHLEANLLVFLHFLPINFPQIAAASILRFGAHQILHGLHCEFGILHSPFTSPPFLPGPMVPAEHGTRHHLRGTRQSCVCGIRIALLDSNGRNAGQGEMWAEKQFGTR